MYNIDHTHDPKLDSWVDSSATDFPIQNLPFCVFRKSTGPPSIGIGIGTQILNLRIAAETGLLDERWADPVSQPTLNDLMALPVQQRLDLRHAISSLLFLHTLADKTALSSAMSFQSDVEFCLPCEIGDFSDFYASICHATNVGSMFRPGDPLLDNYKHLPVGYHGRSSSIVVSGTSVCRPSGQHSPQENEDSSLPTLPQRRPTQMLDYELEVGCFVAAGTQLGETIPIDQAPSHLFGMCLLNDWSARDLQKWEYRPLGPFLSKSFLTTISPWVVTMEALAPFCRPSSPRPSGDPSTLDYLTSPRNTPTGFDIQLEVFLQSAQMKAQQLPPLGLSAGNLQTMYWTFDQILTHQSSNGCNLRPGDLLGSGTVSGPARESRGCLLELTWDGDAENPLPVDQRTPIKLPTGERRTFLEDGDEVIFQGYCESENHRRIGMGSCSGTVKGKL